METMLRALNPLYLAREDATRTGLAWTVHLAPQALQDAARVFLDAGLHLEDICGLDVKEGLCIVYHFDGMEAFSRVEVRVMVPHDAPEVSSIAAVYAGAEWHERETADFYGVVFTGNPNPAPLLMPEGMQGYPLCKEPSARASLAATCATEGRGAEVLHSEDGFTLLDAPATAPGAKQEKPVRKPKEAADDA